MGDLAALQNSLGVRFQDLSLLERALVHSSYLNEHPELALTSNERLEFLGDAVLGVAVAEKLYQDYPDFDEGEMTRIRAALVRRETLARIAGAIGLGDHLYMGKGEEAGGGRHKAANLASALEAVIAAVFLDRGLSAARGYILRLFDAELKKTAESGATADYKSELQHLTQSREQGQPVYQLIEASGPAHSKTFTVEVKLGAIVLGRGSGKTKKAAENEAARVALDNMSNPFTR